MEFKQVYCQNFLNPFIHPFILVVSKYLLSMYYTPGTVLVAGDTAVSQTKSMHSVRERKTIIFADKQANTEHDQWWSGL